MGEDNCFMLNKFYLNIELEGLPTNGNGRQHWSAKYAENNKWKKKMENAIGSNKPALPLKRVKLQFTRCSCGMNDWDNLVICFKPIQDALVECGILENDAVENIPEMPVYSQEKVKRGEGKVRIQVWEL